MYFFHLIIYSTVLIRFAKYREVREALHNFEGVLLACLALAFEELSPHLQFMSEVSFSLFDVV